MPPKPATAAKVPSPPKAPHIKVICKNNRAFHNYHIEERFEAGIVLQGTEVKSLRAGKAHLTDAHAIVRNGEAWLLGGHIAASDHSHAFDNHDPGRTRKLLLHAQELRKLEGRIEQKGKTLIPLSLYFKDGKAKVELGLATGKKLHDKRQTLRERDDRREAERALKTRR